MSQAEVGIKATEARQLLENRAYKAAVAKVGEYLEQQALGCDPDNQAKAQRIILAKQLLSAIQREIARAIEDGEIAKIQMDELERQKKGLLRRFVR